MNSVELQVCCKRGKLAGSISKVSGTISLLSVKFLSMADDVFFRLPFAKVEEMDKSFRDNEIRDADVLSFRDRLETVESDLKRKNMWGQLKSGKLHRRAT